MMETSKHDNNRALANLKNKLLEKLNDRSILACHSLSLLSKITKPGTY